MALLALAAACSSGGEAGTLAPTTAPPTFTLPPTTAAATSAPTTHANTTTTSLPATVPVGGTASLAVVLADSAAFSFSPWAEGFVPAIGEAHLAGAWEIDPATLDLVPDLVVALPTTDNGGVVVRPDGHDWSVEADLDATFGLVPAATYRKGTLLVDDDRMRLKLTIGVPYRRYLFDARPQFTWVHGELELDYRTPPFANRRLVLSYETIGTLSRYARADLGMSIPVYTLLCLGWSRLVAVHGSEQLKQEILPRAFKEVISPEQREAVGGQHAIAFHRLRDARRARLRPSKTRP